MWIVEPSKSNTTTLAGCNRCLRKKRRGALLRTNNSLNVAEYVKKHGHHKE